MVQKHIILRKRHAPVQVNLPNGRSFMSRWERTSRKQLPINIKVSKNRTIGPRRGTKRQIARQEKNRDQIGSGLGENLLKAGINLGSKAIGSDIGKKIINKGINNIPNIFKFGRSKVKNKNIKRALESDIADMIVGEVKNKARKAYNSANLID